MVMKKRACLLCVVIAWSVYLFLLPNFESLGALIWSQNLPPNLAPQNEVALEQGVWPPVEAVEAVEQSSGNVIPHNIFFTYKTDLIGPNNELNLMESIFRENVLHTANLYRAAWRSSKQSEGSVYFLDNDKCRDVIQKTEPLLVAHFNEEKKGMYKADTCRVAALFAHGGYYFDSDLLAIKAFLPKPSTEFVTVAEPRHFHLIDDTRPNFFQAFLATSKGNPILKLCLEQILDYYRGNIALPPYYYLGTFTLRKAFDNYERQLKGLSQDHQLSKVTNMTNPLPYTEILDEVSVKIAYPNVKSPQFSYFYRACNYIVHDPRKQHIHFHSRVVGTDLCPTTFAIVSQICWIMAMLITLFSGYVLLSLCIKKALKTSGNSKFRA